MIQIDKAILSLDIIEQKFECDLQACKGACRVIGDSGAPLEEKELVFLKKFYPQIKPYMEEKGIQAIEEQGLYITDFDGDKVTPLVNNQECAYVYFDGDITKCAIEQAYFDGKISFRKPISCHLYPIRITSYKKLDAVNYDTQSFCKTAREKGKSTGMPVYKFTKDSLSRKYGSTWVKKMNEIAKEYLKQTGKDEEF